MTGKQQKDERGRGRERLLCPHRVSTHKESTKKDHVGSHVYEGFSKSQFGKKIYTKKIKIVTRGIIKKSLKKEYKTKKVYN